MADQIAKEKAFDYVTFLTKHYLHSFYNLASESSYSKRTSWSEI